MFQFMSQRLGPYSARVQGRLHRAEVLWQHDLASLYVPHIFLQGQAPQGRNGVKLEQQIHVCIDAACKIIAVAPLKVGFWP